MLQDTSRETTIVDAEIVATKHRTAFKRYNLTAIGDPLSSILYPLFSGPRIITVPEDTKPHTLLGYFLISNNQDIYRGVSCYIKQVEIIRKLDSKSTVTQCPDISVF